MPPPSLRDDGGLEDFFKELGALFVIDKKHPSS